MIQRVQIDAWQAGNCHTWN